MRRRAAWTILMLGVCTHTLAALSPEAPPARPQAAGPGDEPGEGESSPTDTESPPALSSEVARARLIALVSELRTLAEGGDPDTPGRAADLADRLSRLADRTDDPDLIAAARVNHGLAMQLAGRSEDAPASYRAADLVARHDLLRAEARFNLAHALYADATAPPAPADSLEQQSRPPNPIDELRGRIARLRPAAAAFRAVLDVDPDRTDAAENCEKIRRQIARAQQELEQLEQLMEQMRQQGENLDSLADEQQDASDESEQSDQSRREELEQQQQDISRQTEQAQQQLEQTRQQASRAGQQQMQQQIRQSQDDVEEARAAQERAEQALREGDLDRASEEQQQAADALRRAAENLQQGNEQSEGDQQQQQEDQPNPDEHNRQTGQQQQQQQEPGDQLVEDLLDREERQREERELRRSRLARPATVERDW
ncbi:MAG: hypothetical protein ACF8Q5_06110 [Phycisphaerales bacterium JB040]